MELALFVIFAWFLFILGKHFKDFAITFISGMLILSVGIISFPSQQNFLLAEFGFALTNLCVGLYIIFRSLVELLGLYFRPTLQDKLNEIKAEEVEKNAAKALEKNRRRRKR